MTFQNAGDAAPSPPSVPVIGPAPARPVRFLGDPRAFWRLLARGAVLLAFTLGIYRFWLATDVRRFLWSNTEIAGDHLEYNGTATELLIGFLIAIALLLPINLGFFVLALGMGTIGEFTGVIGFPVLFVLGQFAIFRARRYRLTRSVLRGIRFHQTGSAWRYAVCGTFWWTLVLLTLGLAYPFAQASLERYKMRNTHYGDVPGRFEGSGLRLFLRGILMWFLVVVPFVFGIFAAIGAVDWDALNAMTSHETAADITQVQGLAAGAFIAVAGVTLSVIMAVVLYPIFLAMTMRWWLSGLRFGELAVRSQLRKRRIFGAYLRFLLYAFLFTIAGSVAAGIGLFVHPSLTRLFGQTGGEIATTVGAVGFYVVMMLGYSTIYQATVKLALWCHGAESVEIEGLAVLDRVSARGGPGSAVGEGLADALNVGGI
jgi:uncharacterized membrane protein YjgN (DUF898 family)